MSLQTGVCRLFASFLIAPFIWHDFSFCSPDSFPLLVGVDALPLATGTLAGANKPECGFHEPPSDPLRVLHDHSFASRLSFIEKHIVSYYFKNSFNL